MLNATEPVTEKAIREKLEASGQLGKMRAMVIDAALNSFSNDEEKSAKLFMPSPLLKASKETVEGRQALGILSEYLEYLGLTYTLNVLKHEASLKDSAIEENMKITRALNISNNDVPVLTTLIRTIGNNLISDNQKEKTLKKDDLVHTTSAVAAVATVPKVEEGGEDSTYFLSKWSGREFYRHGGQVSGQQIQLEYLKDCTVYVLDPLDSITVDDCEGGELVIAACEGSVFLRNCKNMIVHVACKQLRTRDCEHIEFRIFTSTDPVIEASHHITFKPFHLRLPDLNNTFKAARLDPKMNRFVHVYDFTEDDQKLPKPHLSVLYPDHGLLMHDRCHEKGTPECPPEIEDLLEGRMQPASSSESGRNKSHNIKTGARIWTEAAAEPSDKEENNNTFLTTKQEAIPTVKGVPAVTPEVDFATDPQKKLVPTTTGLTTAGRVPSDGSYSSFDDDDDDQDDDDDMDVDEDSDDF
ncbi:FGFR1 oncogene partner (FOP) [Trypanosoma melophagium]|uniref:FGFR1 oncogene partner (FOP) n=1 Tax=Trypanosoma melophagium TaxID=715481 RepID=UPI00351A6B04|nr:FGFR1 oncogene partner (FOP) [Trypanosoma melophagium]